MGEKHNRRAVIGALVAALTVVSCGSSTTDEPVTATEAESLVVQQGNAMRALRDWGGDHLHITWSDGTARITNDGDQILLCGVTSTEVSYQPDQYFGIRPHRSRELAAPASPFVGAWSSGSTLPRSWVVTNTSWRFSLRSLRPASLRQGVSRSSTPLRSC